MGITEYPAAFKGNRADGAKAVRRVYATLKIGDAAARNITEARQGVDHHD